MRCSSSATGNGLAAYASRMPAIVRCQDWRRRRNPARAITESAVPRSPSDAGSGTVPVSEKAALKVGAELVGRWGADDIGADPQPIGIQVLIPGPALEIGKSGRERRARRDDRFGGGQPQELPAVHADLRNEKVVIGRQNQRRLEIHGELHLGSGHRTIALVVWFGFGWIPPGWTEFSAVKLCCSVLVVKVRSPAVRVPTGERDIGWRVRSCRDVGRPARIRILREHPIDLDHHIVDAGVRCR